MEKIYDVIVIGGGIVGLATALQIKQKAPHLSLAILEKEEDIARHQTGNNSGVIHAGLYYKPGSLKALNCLRGYKRLIEFCTRENIPFERCGKLVVATRREELPRLENLYERGIQNGLSSIIKITAEEIKEYEPYVNGLAGIWVPYTGIVDYKQVSKKYASILVDRLGAEIYTSTCLKAIHAGHGYVDLVTPGKTFHTKLLINTTGLYSDRIAKMEIPDLDVRIIPFRGEYYRINQDFRYLVKNLVYPVPDPAFPFLGVHFTRHISGDVEAGPNAVFAFSREAYNWSTFSLSDVYESFQWKGFRSVMKTYWKVGLGEYYRSLNKSAFTRALKRLLPSIEKHQLIPGGAGIRAQACSSDGRLVDDFLIRESRYGIHVLNAPSPAATASLAIGETIANMAIKKLKEAG